MCLLLLSRDDDTQMTIKLVVFSKLDNCHMDISIKLMYMEIS